MNSVILQIASKYVRWLLVIFSVIMLLRGHNLPGGGFIGGLLAGLSLAYKGFAFTPSVLEKEMKIRPEIFMVFGLVLIFISLWPGVVLEGTLMQGIWFTIPFPFTEGYKFGTPFLFDIGVYFVVIGVTVLFLFSLSDKD
ncbi:MAG: MnhB domain-containing protein [Paludibacter sp.]|jgi:multicomponent Na+:H+ antiporter subunit B|nr:MnhB domain-containing protein [Paludibacter sp.]